MNLCRVASSFALIDLMSQSEKCLTSQSEQFNGIFRRELSGRKSPLTPHQFRWFDHVRIFETQQITQKVRSTPFVQDTRSNKMADSP